MKKYLLSLAAFLALSGCEGQNPDIQIFKDEQTRADVREHVKKNIEDRIKEINQKKLIDAAQKIKQHFGIPNDVSVVAYNNDKTGMISIVVAGREHLLYDEKAGVVTVGKTFLLKDNQPPTDATQHVIELANESRLAESVSKFRELQPKAKELAAELGFKPKGSCSHRATMYVFTSPTCPHCHELVKLLDEKKPDMSIYHYPIGGNSHADDIIKTMLCNTDPKQAYFDVMKGKKSEKICNIDEDKKSDEISRQLNELAKSVGVQAFPAVFTSFSDGTIIFDEGITDRLKKTMDLQAVEIKKWEKK